MINLYTKLHVSKCNFYKENEKKLGGPTDRETDRQQQSNMPYKSKVFKGLVLLNKN